MIHGNFSKIINNFVLNYRQIFVLIIEYLQWFKNTKSYNIEHIKNIYKEGELIENEIMTKFGNSEFADKPTNYYNLDMIISVGYRVKSQNGILFRKWATSVLKDYMLKGYAINQERLEYLEKTIKLIYIANRIDERLEGNDAKEILKVIGGYSKALDLLDDYDHRTLKRMNYNNVVENLLKLLTK